MPHSSAATYGQDVTKYRITATCLNEEEVDES